MEDKIIAEIKSMTDMIAEIKTKSEAKSAQIDAHWKLKWPSTN